MPQRSIRFSERVLKEVDAVSRTRGFASTTVDLSSEIASRGRSKRCLRTSTLSRRPCSPACENRPPTHDLKPWRAPKNVITG
jgi:hypothetical protein